MSKYSIPSKYQTTTGHNFLSRMSIYLAAELMLPSTAVRVPTPS